jgi:hypothetical protein
VSRIAWALTHLLLGALERDERDAVLGDLLELRTPPGRALLDVSGLVARRHAQHLLGWRPMLAIWGIAVPLAGLLALRVRIAAEGTAIHAFLLIENWSPAFLDSPGARRDLADIVTSELMKFATLSVWSWTIGFVTGSLSRATAWASGTAFALVLLVELAMVTQHHHPGNAAAFESLAYGTVVPLLMRACFVLAPMAWGLRMAVRRVGSRR